MPYLEKRHHIEHDGRKWIEVEQYFSGMYGNHDTRLPRWKMTSEQVEIINRRRAAKGLRRLILLNFSPGDLYLTFTYKKGVRVTPEEAVKILDRFMRRLKYQYNKRGQPFKWIKTTGLTSTGKAHHHVIMNRVEGVPYDNAEIGVPLAPSDTAVNYVRFLDRCRQKWGLAKNVFIDSADQATITELEKYKRKHAECLYIFNNAWKKMKIVDRIILQLGWMNYSEEDGIVPDFYIVNTCTVYQKEMNTYSWKEDKDQEPEDGNDHMVNSVQYGWIPYREKIGGKR